MSATKAYKQTSEKEKSVINNHIFQNATRFAVSVTEDQERLRASVGRPQTSSSPPVIFIAGRPKAALLFWFFGDFRCGALLFMVIHVIYKYKNK